MSPARTAARLVRLYPVGWRARYGDELQTLILDMSSPRRVPWRIRADVAGAGGRERLRAAGLGDGSPGGRVRAGAGLVLWAWALFVLAGAILQRTSEHWDSALPGDHLVPTAAFDVLIGAAIATSFLVLTGIALTLPALSRLLREGGWARIRRAVLPAGLLTVITIAATVALIGWAHGLTAADRAGHDGVYVAGFLAWAVLGGATLGAWTSAATRTAACLALGRGILRLEARLATAVAAAMVVMAAATAVWWVSVGTVAPTDLTGSSGPRASALVPGVVVAMVLMLAAVGLGGTGARRATGALPDLTDAV